MTIGSSRLRRPALAAFVTTVVLTGMLIAAPAANAAVLTQSLGADLTATQLAGALVGTGVTVSNAAFAGASSGRTPQTVPRPRTAPSVIPSWTRSYPQVRRPRTRRC